MPWKAKDKHRTAAFEGQRIERNFKKCSDKNCYSKNAAERVALNVMRKRNRKVHVYECDVCHYYHLTSIDHFGPRRIGRTDKPGRRGKY